MSFSSNFKTRMLFLDQAYDSTKHRWVIFEKIFVDGQRVGMRMKTRTEPGIVIAETYIDGRIILHQGFEQLAGTVRREIKDAVEQVAILIKEVPGDNHWRHFKERVYQRKILYTKDANFTSGGDFADFLTKKFQAGSQQGVQSSQR